MSTADKTAGAADPGADAPPVTGGSDGLMRGESSIPRYIPEGTLISGPLRVIEFAGCRAGEAHVRMPSWLLTFGVVVNRVRFSGRGPRLLLGFSLMTGLRAKVGEAEHMYGRCRVLTLEWPVRLHWLTNDNPSRAWTGRRRELARIDYWTPRGWKCRVLGRS